METHDGLYPTLLSAKADENIKAIGFSTSKLDLAKEALETKLYDVIFLEYSIGDSPLENDIAFFEECKKQEIGLIINYKTPVSYEIDFSLIFGFLRKHENLVPKKKKKNQEDLQQLLYVEAKPPQLDENYLEELVKKN